MSERTREVSIVLVLVAGAVAMAYAGQHEIAATLAGAAAGFARPRLPPAITAIIACAIASSIVGCGASTADVVRTTCGAVRAAAIACDVAGRQDTEVCDVRQRP